MLRTKLATMIQKALSWSTSTANTFCRPCVDAIKRSNGTCWYWCPCCTSRKQPSCACDDELVEILDGDAFPSALLYCISLLRIALPCFVTHHFAWLHAALLCLICIASLHFETRVKSHCIELYCCWDYCCCCCCCCFCS